ncbi:TPA: type III secretion system gatekeeper subunit SctW [Yersinia enterocolitica]|nr:type III secretion system gatekeeper subunit SctW [Yersinia enterocolitica]
MAINIPPPMDPAGGGIRKKNNNIRDNHVAHSDHDVQQDVSKVADETPAAEQWRFLQSADEMSAAITQFHNRKLYEKKREEISSGFEQILEEDAESKTDRILQTTQNPKVELHVLVDFIRKLFPDESDLVQVLRELISRKKIDKVAKKKLEEILLQIEKQSDPKFIKSGINCALKAQLFGKKLALNPKILRASYREFLLSDSSAVEVYIDWISNYGYKKRQSILEFIEGSLLSDINSLDASCSTIEFGLFLQKLCHLQLLQAAERLFLRYVISSVGVSKLNDKEELLLYFLISLLKKPESIDVVLAEVLQKTYKKASRKEILALLLTLYRGLQKLPISLFLQEDSLQYILEYMRNIIKNNYVNEKLEPY